MAKLFGFSIEDQDLKKGAKNATSPIAPTDNDTSSAIVPYGGWFGHYVDLDGVKGIEMSKPCPKSIGKWHYFLR